MFAFTVPVMLNAGGNGACGPRGVAAIIGGAMGMLGWPPIGPPWKLVAGAVGNMLRGRGGGKPLGL
jgi:hypothetical protein